MNRAEYELRVTLKGFVDIYKNEDNFVTFINRLKAIAKQINDCELIGLGLNKYYAMPLFDIDGRIYLLWNSHIVVDDTELYFVKPWDFEISDWQECDDFLKSHIN